MYKLALQQLPDLSPRIFRWCLDFPVNEGGVSLTELETEGVLFQGWVLVNNGDGATPFVRVGEECHYFPLNVNRPDVIRKVLTQEPGDHPQFPCGFRFRIPLATGDAVFGFRLENCDIDYVTLRVEGEMKVLEGAAGWLFLDNDTNRSVEQFTGALQLTRAEQKSWREYFDEFANTATRMKFQHAVLIAPSKEVVLAEQYPFQKGKTTPVDQVLNVAGKKHRVVYPVESLQGSPERTFLITDTHWSAHGAMLAVTDVLVQLGFASNQVQEVFAGDQYREREVTGDLGNKFYPCRTAAEKFLVSYRYQQHTLYDNHLPNFGRVMVVSNPEALVASKCMIFGGSSSYSTLPFFSRIFSELILIHSAGNIDMDLVRHESPHYVIAQTNGRFVIRPLNLNYSLTESIKNKMAELSEESRDEVLRKSGQWLEKNSARQIRYYHELLLT